MRIPNRSLARAAVLALLLSLPALPAGAQAPGVIAGRVTLDGGFPAVGVEVRVEGAPLATHTDRAGAFRIPGIPAGEHTVRMQGIGYLPGRFPVRVGAGEVARLDGRLRPQPVALDGITVVAGRSGEALALQRQRAADNLRSVVAAEVADRFPDPNAAEALQRLPGVALQRDQGEGRYLMVRGTEARLSYVSANGIRLPAPDGEFRQVALDVLPTDLFGQLEIHKTLTPDMDGDAIGGAIELSSRFPSVDRAPFDLSAATGVSRLEGGTISQLSGTLARRFGPGERLGVALAGGWSRAERGSDDLEMEWGEAFDAPVIGDLQLRDYQVLRRRTGFGAVLDYRLPDDQSSVALTALLSGLEDQEYRRRSRLRFDEGDFTAPSRVSDAVVERALRDRFESQRIWTVGLSGEQALGRGTATYGASLARATEEMPDRTEIVFAQEGMDFAVDLARPDRPAYTVLRGEEFDDGAYAFEEWSAEDETTGTRESALSLGYSLPLARGATSLTLQAGAKLRRREKEREARVRVHDGFEGDLTLDGLAGAPGDDALFGALYRVGRLPDPAAARRFFRDHLHHFALDADASREGSDPATYSATESVTAGYLMATLETGRLRLLPGVRVEALRHAYAGNEVAFSEEGEYEGTRRLTGRGSGVHLLPGLNARLRLDEHTQLRFAATRSLSLPDHEELVPFRIVNREDGELERGNPELEPTTSRNLDLAVERYLPGAGVFGAALFHKRIRGHVYQERVELEEGEFRGFEALQPRSGGEGTLSGVELSWSRRLDFLPGALGGLGLWSNYLLTRSRTVLPGRTVASRLPGQMGEAGNLALEYDGHGISGRVALHYTGAYLQEVGESAAQDVFVDRHLQADLSLAWRAGRGTSLFLEAVNLTDEPYRAYQGERSRPVQIERYSWWAHLGVKLHAR